MKYCISKDNTISQGILALRDFRLEYDTCVVHLSRVKMLCLMVKLSKNTGNVACPAVIIYNENKK